MPVPAWYHDPAQPGQLRWWDGRQWSPYTAPLAPPARVDVRRDAADEAHVAPRARWAVLGGLLTYIGQQVYLAIVAPGVIDQIREAVRLFDAGDDTAANDTLNHLDTGWGGWSYLFEAALVAVAVYFFIWLHRSAGLARHLGLPAARSPVWAILGFIVPVVNLWFPYQVVRDLFPREHPARADVKVWWALYLTAGFGTIAIGAAAFFGTAAALVVLAGIAVVWVLAALRIRKIIAAAVRVHHELIGMPLPDSSVALSGR